MEMDFVKKLIEGLILILVATLVISCGGGGGGGGAAVDTGSATIGVLVTDASSDDYDEAITTINEITLLCEGGQQEIFSGSISVDLLKLKNHLDLLTVAEGVQPGTCSKIRLRVSRMLLIKRDESGVLEEKTEVNLVANGKIDLNPRSNFVIRAGHKLFITLDFDMEKSLKFTEASADKIILRPVIFVDIAERPLFKNGLTRVHGRIEAIADDLRGFVLCRTELVARPLEFDESHDIPKPCIRVALNERTGLFGETGEPINANQLEEMDPVTVVGFIRLADAPVLTHNESDLNFVLRAIVVERGEPGTWSRIPGELQSIVDPVENTYLLQALNRDDVSIDWLLDGQLYTKSRVFTFDGRELDRFSLKAGDKILVDGVVVPAEAADANDRLNTAFMLVKESDGTPPLEESTLIGKVKTVHPDTDSLVVATDAGDRCVAAEDAIVLFLIESPGSLEVIKGRLEDLPEDAIVVIFGTDPGGCFMADAIVTRGPMKP